MPAAGNPASATELPPPCIGEPPAPAAGAGRPVARRAGRDRQPARETGPAGTSAGAAMLPHDAMALPDNPALTWVVTLHGPPAKKTIMVQAWLPRPADESRRRTRTCDRATARGQRDTLTNDRRKTPQNGPLCALHPSRTRHRPVVPSRRSGIGLTGVVTLRGRRWSAVGGCPAGGHGRLGRSRADRAGDPAWWTGRPNACAGRQRGFPSG
jgi:hypothetical protein